MTWVGTMRSMTSTIVLGQALFAAMCLAANAHAGPPAAAVIFDGAAWRLSGRGVSLFGFEPAPPTDPGREADQLTIVVMDGPNQNVRAPQLAAAMLQETRRQETVLKA